MKKWKLPRLSRGGQTVRNLAVTAFWLVLLWGISDYPIRDPVGIFHRAERSCWVGPSDIQYVGDRYGTVGTYMDQVVIGTGEYALDYWPRDPEGPTLVPLGQFEFAAVDIPEGTARAELTLELSFYYFPALSDPADAGPTYAVREQAEEERGVSGPIELWQDTYVCQGELAEEGGVLFRAEPKSPGIPGELGVWDGHPLLEVTDRDIYSRAPWDNQAWARMEAVFYGEAGNVLGRAVLSTPEGGQKRVS